MTPENIDNLIMVTMIIGIAWAFAWASKTK